MIWLCHWTFSSMKNTAALVRIWWFMSLNFLLPIRFRNNQTIQFQTNSKNTIWLTVQYWMWSNWMRILILFFIFFFIGLINRYCFYYTFLFDRVCRDTWLNIYWCEFVSSLNWSLCLIVCELKPRLVWSNHSTAQKIEINLRGSSLFTFTSDLILCVVSFIYVFAHSECIWIVAIQYCH